MYFLDKWEMHSFKNLYLGSMQNEPSSASSYFIFLHLADVLKKYGCYPYNIKKSSVVVHKRHTRTQTHTHICTHERT